MSREIINSNQLISLHIILEDYLCDLSVLVESFFFLMSRVQGLTKRLQYNLDKFLKLSSSHCLKSLSWTAVGTDWLQRFLRFLRNDVSSGRCRPPICYATTNTPHWAGDQMCARCLPEWPQKGGTRDSTRWLLWQRPCTSVSVRYRRFHTREPVSDRLVQVLNKTTRVREIKCTDGHIMGR